MKKPFETEKVSFTQALSGFEDECLAAAAEAVSAAASATAKAAQSSVHASLAAVEAASQALAENVEESRRITEILKSLSHAYGTQMDAREFAILLAQAYQTTQDITKKIATLAAQAKSRTQSAKIAARAATAVNDAALTGAQIASKRARLASLIRQKKVKDSQKAVETLAAASVAEAELASRIKTMFIANMSHEIRTPLAVIKGFAELLAKSQQGNQEHSRWLASVLSATLQLESLINDMLDISKIEAGRLDVELHPASLRQIIRDVTSLMDSRARDKGLSLVVSGRGQLPLSVLTDTGRLNQILINIVGNAIKFTEQGSVEIEVSLVPHPKNPSAHLLSFKVKDDGIGISAEQEKRLFVSFSQADSTITRRFGGTGLGLSLSRRLANLLGGDVTLVPENRKGSIFEITIDPGPIEACNLEDSGQFFSKALESVTPVSADLPVLQGYDVLVVEDAPDLGLLLRHILQAQGARVDLVSNGREGILAVRKASYSVVLMDIQMPVIDGYEATRQLRLEGFTLPIFALTAHAMKGERERCLAAGFTDYLTKPVQVKKLLELIKSTVPRSRSDLE